MSKTLTPEEFEKGNSCRTSMDRYTFAEYYHKAKVESITDEECYNEANKIYPNHLTNEKNIFGYAGFGNGYKWLKQKLLEQ